MTKPERRTLYIGIIIVSLSLALLFIGKGWGVRGLEVIGIAAAYVLLMGIVFAVAALILTVKDNVFIRTILKSRAATASEPNLYHIVARRSWMWIVTPLMLTISVLIIYFTWSHYLTTAYQPYFYVGFLVSLSVGIIMNMKILQQDVQKAIKHHVKKRTYSSPIIAAPLLFLGVVLYGSFPARKGALYFLVMQFFKNHPDIEAIFIGVLGGFFLSINVSYFFQALQGKGVFAPENQRRHW